MRWQLHHASKYQAAVQAGRDVPDDMHPPMIMQGFEGWLDAFWELCTDRQIGMAQGPIPAASIDRWSADMDPEGAAMFRRCIRAMDAEWMGEAAKASGKRDRSIEVKPSEAKSVIGGILKRKGKKR